MVPLHTRTHSLKRNVAVLFVDEKVELNCSNSKRYRSPVPQYAVCSGRVTQKPRWASTSWSSDTQCPPGRWFKDASSDRVLPEGRHLKSHVNQRYSHILIIFHHCDTGLTFNIGTVIAHNSRLLNLGVAHNVDDGQSDAGTKGWVQVFCFCSNVQSGR